MKGLKQIWQVPPTHIDRSWTNKKVIEEIEEHTGITIQRCSEIANRKKYTLSGHIFKANLRDPMRQVIFETASDILKIVFKKRVGKPRLDWLEETMRECWGKICTDGTEFNKDRILNAAKNSSS